MKLFLRLILIAGLTFLLSSFLPWWILTIVGFVVGWVVPGGLLSGFVSGFLGVAIVWMGYAWKLDTENNSVFSTKILEILPLGQPIILIATLGFVGGLCGGFATMTGALMRKPKKKKNTGGYYQ